MADRRKPKRKKEAEQNAESDKPSKLEYEVAKYLRAKLQQKKTTLLSHKVDYFIASKAVDLLLESKWSKEDKRTNEIVFANRESVVRFMEQMLRHKFFHRAKTVIVRKDNKKKKTDAEESSAAEDKDKEKKKQKKSSKKLAIKEKEESKDKESKESKDKVEKADKKEKKKIKLDMHLEQLFVDGVEPYVWIYDHIPLKTWFIGAGLVFGAIAVCLFPLWPRSVRNYVYYLSIAAAAFLFFIIGLAVLRLVIFTLVWVFTFGKHHFWLLPNLTEDVGFFESFWPIYKYEFKGSESKSKKKKSKDSDNSDNNQNDGNDSGSESASTVETNEKAISSNDNAKEITDGNNGSNGFEILDSNELEDNEEEEGIEENEEDEDSSDDGNEDDESNDPKQKQKQL